MFMEMLQGKIHRGAVSDCRIDYEGSLTVDPKLIEEAGLRTYQKIQVLNITNGQRIETYLIDGQPGSGEICVNGAAARLFCKGDRVIICGYGFYDPKELAGHKPKVVVLDERNKIIDRH
jgi:aspartate 1-decarboxylase